MIDSDGSLKLCDYTASVFNHYLEKLIKPETANDGKALYLAPEVNLEEKYDSRCDVWSVGCLAYEMLTAKPLFAEETGGGNLDKMISIINKKSKLLHFCTSSKCISH